MHETRSSAHTLHFAEHLIGLSAFITCLLAGCILPRHGCTMLSGMIASAGVWAVALTPDGRRAITAGEDFTARVWDVLTGRCTANLAGHSGWVVDVAVTPNGTRCITASHDGTARCPFPSPPNRTQQLH